MQNIFMSQLLQYDNLPIFTVICDSKHNILGLWIWMEKKQKISEDEKSLGQ